MTGSKPRPKLTWKGAKDVLFLVAVVAIVSAMIALRARGKPFDWGLASTIALMVGAMVAGAAWLIKGPITGWMDRHFDRRFAGVEVSDKRLRAAIAGLDPGDIEEWAVSLMRKEHNDPANDEDRRRLSRVTDLPDSLRRFFAYFPSAHVDGFGTTISQDTVTACEKDPGLLRIGDGPDGDEVFVERTTGRVIATILNEDFPLDLSDAHPSVFHWIVYMHADVDPSCSECGYALRGLPDFKCPECGHDSAPQLSAMQGRRPGLTKKPGA